MGKLCCQLCPNLGRHHLDKWDILSANKQILRFSQRDFCHFKICKLLAIWLSNFPGYIWSLSKVWSELVRFPNPLATGSYIHGSWGTWLDPNLPLQTRDLCIVPGFAAVPQDLLQGPQGPHSPGVPSQRLCNSIVQIRIFLDLKIGGLVKRNNKSSHWFPVEIFREIIFLLFVAFFGNFGCNFYQPRCFWPFFPGCFFHWYPHKKLKYGKPRLGEFTLM